MQVYIFGNGNLDFSDFQHMYQAPLEQVLSESDPEFLLCDFRGVDTLAMELLKTLTSKVSVFHVGERPRYFPDKYRTKASSWKLIGGYEGDAERDAAAIEACSHFIAFDFNSNAKRKSGTQRNIERCLELGKIRIGQD